MSPHRVKRKDRFDIIPDWWISRAEAALADLLAMVNRLYKEGYTSGAIALRDRENEFLQIKLQFDGNITCLDMNGNCMFHHDKRLIGKNLGKYKDVSGRYVFQKLSTTRKGVRKWIDDFDPEEFHREGLESYIEAGKEKPIRANYAIYIFCKPWKWFLIIEIHSKLGGRVTAQEKKLLVFLSHASEDKVKVHKLAKRLKDDGFEPWVDEEQLLPGQDWNLEIEKALRASDAILLCFSALSVAKEGYIQREYKRAMMYREEKPEGTIFVIPVRLDNCDLPHFVREVQWVDYPAHYYLLVKSLKVRGQSSVNSEKIANSKPKKTPR